MNAKLILATALFHVLLLVGIFADFYFPVYSGKDVVVAATARDPRDLLRGQYARLDYSFLNPDISKLKSDLQPGSELEYGDFLYAVLEPGKDAMELAGIYKTKPESEIFLRGRLQDEFTVPAKWTEYSEKPQIRYQIEAWFTSPEEAKKLEERLLKEKQIFVRLRVSRGGRARLVEILQ